MRKEAKEFIKNRSRTWYVYRIPTDDRLPSIGFAFGKDITACLYSNVIGELAPGKSSPTLVDPFTVELDGKVIFHLEIPELVAEVMRRVLKDKKPSVWGEMVSEDLYMTPAQYSLTNIIP